VRNEDTAEIAVLDFEYSGGTSVEFTRVAKPRPHSHLHACVGLARTTPFRVVEPGGKVTSPRVHISTLYGDADTCANALFKHLRTSVLPSHWGISRMRFSRSAVTRDGRGLGAGGGSTEEETGWAGKASGRAFFLDRNL
jgi:hypothetical protein